jgi:hypothetical protein
MKTCGKGHEYSTLKCSVCASMRSKRSYLKHKEKVLQRSMKWYAENKEVKLAQGVSWRASNKDRVKKNVRRWAAANPEKIAETQKKSHLKHKEKYDIVGRAWRVANREKLTAYVIKRHATQLQRTPPWYNHSDVVAIYKEAKPGYHIDHIVPLQGKNVSGLHWHHNLQVLPAAENISKSNKFNPDTYIHELPLY